MRLWPLIPAWLLLASVIAGAALSIARQNLSIAASPAELTVTLTTNDIDNKGETIQISGTVKDSNTPVANGTVTIQLSCLDWSQKHTVQTEDNGSYSGTHYISYGNPPGTWTITVTAVDNLGNIGENSKSITVGLPENDVYSPLFTSPATGSYMRGKPLTISATFTHGESNVEGATVFANSPTGEDIPLSGTAAGTYENTYKIKFDDPVGNWSISVEAKKTSDNTFQAGGTYKTIQIENATLAVNLQRPGPTENTFEAGKEVVVRVEVLYPFDGGPVEGATVSVNNPAGGSLTLTPEGSGVYSTTYAPQNIDNWSMVIQAFDPDNNYGETRKLINFTAPGVPSFLEQYWWAILSGILAIALVSVYSGRKKRLANKLVDIQREIKEIPKLKKDAAIKYFKNGTISRSAYDGLVKKYDARMDVLKRQETELKVKLKKIKKK